MVEYNGVSHYTLSEAAEILGMSSGRIRQMCQAYAAANPPPADLGWEYCRGVKYHGPFPHGYVWIVSPQEVARLKVNPAPTGRPRGATSASTKE